MTISDTKTRLLAGVKEVDGCWEWQRKIDKYGYGHAENQRRAMKTHCKRRHEYTQDNTYMARSGARVCRMCWVENSRAYLMRKKARAAWIEEECPL